jgi:hypothetical protein
MASLSSENMRSGLPLSNAWNVKRTSPRIEMRRSSTENAGPQCRSSDSVADGLAAMK